MHVNRASLHALEVPATFEAEGSFDILLTNHGESLHLHVHLDDALSEVATIDAGNHYVEGETQRAVRVHVDEDRLTEEPHHGKIKVVSAYGAETRWIDVELARPTPEDEGVTVDESLGEPAAGPAGGEPSPAPALDRPELPVLALGLVALVVAVLAAVFIRNTLVLVGSLVVLGGVLLALVVLLWE